MTINGLSLTPWGVSAWSVIPKGTGYILTTVFLAGKPEPIRHQIYVSIPSEREEKIEQIKEEFEEFLNTNNKELYYERRNRLNRRS